MCQVQTEQLSQPKQHGGMRHVLQTIVQTVGSQSRCALCCCFPAGQHLAVS
jgi:hypothetical protein